MIGAVVVVVVLVLVLPLMPLQMYYVLWSYFWNDDYVIPYIGRIYKPGNEKLWPTIPCPWPSSR